MQRPSSRSWLDVALVGSLCAVGAALRATGLTSRDLWFDDAWAALPAHVGLSDAIHMVTTTPLYTIGMRSWILVAPETTWWAQLPAFVLGIAGIAAVYALVRALSYPRVAAVIAAAVIAVGPVTIDYSTRVKEYSADLVLACVVLWLVERWRRDPQPWRMAALCATGVAALWISASVAAIVGGAMIAAVLLSWAEPRRRRQVVTAIGALVVASALEWVVFLRHLPAQLRTNWRTHGFLFGYASVRHVAYAFQQTFSGIAHGLSGVPIAYTFQGYSIRIWPLALAVVTVLVLGVLVGLPLARAVRSRGAVSDVTTAAAAAVCLAVVGTLAGITPLGDGRTDEALYPALILVALSAGRALAPHVTKLVPREGAIARWGCAALLAGAALWFGIAHTASYPPTGLRTVLTQLAPLLKHGDVVVIDGYESFTYGVEQHHPAVSFDQFRVPWPMGFHVAGTPISRFLLSRNYLQSDTHLIARADRAARVWFVGPTVGGYSTAAPAFLWSFPFKTPTLAALERHRWRGVYVCCHAPGVYAQLLTRPG